MVMKMFLVIKLIPNITVISTEQEKPFFKCAVSIWALPVRDVNACLDVLEPFLLTSKWAITFLIGVRIIDS